MLRLSKICSKEWGEEKKVITSNLKSPKNCLSLLKKKKKKPRITFWTTFTEKRITKDSKEEDKIPINKKNKKHNCICTVIYMDVNFC